MNRTIGALAAVAALMSQAAHGDEVRRTVFAGTLVGTWALNAQACDANDKSNYVIGENKYTTSPAGACSVMWIVETAAGQGTNYAVHASCVEETEHKTNITNLIIRSQSNDRLLIGTSFDDVKSYQRCPAK